MVADISYYRIWIPNFSPFCSTTSHLRVTGHIERNIPNYPKVTLNPKMSKVPICVLLMPQGPQILPRFSLRPIIFEIQSCRYSKMQRMTPGTLNRQQNPAYINTYLSEVQIFVRFTLPSAVFNTRGCWMNECSWIHSMTSDWSWTLNSKNTLYICSVPTPGAQIFVRFSQQPDGFKIQGCYKNAPNNLKMTLNT